MGIPCTEPRSRRCSRRDADSEACGRSLSATTNVIEIGEDDEEVAFAHTWRLPPGIRARWIATTVASGDRQNALSFASFAQASTMQLECRAYVLGVATHRAVVADDAFASELVGEARERQAEAKLLREEPVELGELEEPVLRPLRKEAEDVAEIRPRVDREELTAREERREQRVDGAGLSLPTNGQFLRPTASLAKRELAHVVVNRKPSVVEKLREADALIARVANAFRDRRLVEDLVAFGVAPREEGVDDVL